MIRKDEEGYVIVTVADLKEYLSKFPGDMRVGLDKDGWMYEEINPETVQQLIEERGLFEQFEDYLFINN